MATEKTIVLITGASGAIGFELTVHLLSDASKHVLFTSRSVEKGEIAVKDLQSRQLPGTIEFLHVDVTNEESIEAAAKSVESKHGRLDVLVNNAAIGIPLMTDSTSLASQMATSFQTNATGVLLMVEAFVPLLKKSIGTPRIINISSGGGSIAEHLTPKSALASMTLYSYRASKAAMNMLTECQAVEYVPSGFKVFAYSPGFTVSNLAPFNKVENGARPPSVSAAPIVGLINGERDAEHGGFLKETGKHYW